MMIHFKCKYLVLLACLFEGICIESLGCYWKQRSRDKQESLGDFRCCFRPGPWLDMLSMSRFPSRLREISQALQSPPDQLFLKIDTKTCIGTGGWGVLDLFLFFVQSGWQQSHRIPVLNMKPNNKYWERSCCWLPASRFLFASIILIMLRCAFSV